MKIHNLDVLSLENNFTSVGYTNKTSNLVSHAQVESQKKSNSFGQYLINAVSEMNSQQVELSNLEQKAIVDPESVDIHDITTAMAKAQMSLNLAKTVVDRVVSGWQEITTTR